MLLTNNHQQSTWIGIVVGGIAPALVFMSSCSSSQSKQQGAFLENFVGQWEVTSVHWGDKSEDAPGGSINLQIENGKVVGNLLTGFQLELEPTSSNHLQGSLIINGLLDREIIVPARVKLVQNQQLRIEILASQADKKDLPKELEREFSKDAVYLAQRVTHLPTSEVEEAKEAPEIQAEKYLATLNQAKQGFFIEFGTFTSKIANLGLDIPTDTENYSYRVKELNDTLAQSLAIPKKKGLRSYTGGIYAEPAQGSERLTTTAILCESKEPSQAIPDSPQKKEGVLTCPQGFQEIRR